MDIATVQSWLNTLAPYFLVVFPTIIGLGNRVKLSVLEKQGDGHTTALLALASRATDPAIAAKATKARVEAEALAAANVLDVASKKTDL